MKVSVKFQNFRKIGRKKLYRENFSLKFHNYLGIFRELFENFPEVFENKLEKKIGKNRKKYPEKIRQKISGKIRWKKCSGEISDDFPRIFRELHGKSF